jgi:uncharacterized protein (UPF0548 family)
MVNPTTLPADVVRRLRDAGPTYAEVGSTAGVLPPGYRHVSRTVRVGSGIDVFDMAAEAVLRWQVHLRAGLRVAASSPRVERRASSVAAMTWSTSPSRPAREIPAVA